MGSEESRSVRSKKVDPVSRRLRVRYTIWVHLYYYLLPCIRLHLTLTTYIPYVLYPTRKNDDLLTRFGRKRPPTPRINQMRDIRASRASEHSKDS